MFCTNFDVVIVGGGISGLFIVINYVKQIWIYF